ncbi:DUF547 domain-containing protein [Reinekea sp.]|jgi:hypothetical protein|uniref:DUF547 domain-containing protein n=1 Tax=Reinekea sp. TaxID=1970455 RepID=UPI003989E4EF
MPKLYTFLIACLFLAPLSSAKDPIAAFTINDGQSTVVLDHSAWQYFLNNYLEFDDFGQSYFTYQDVTSSDQAQLNNYLKVLSSVSTRSLNAKEEHAFWINLYNALTVKVVLDAYPVDSIKDIDSRFGGLLATGPWSKQRFEVSGIPLSLDNIEHDIIRPKYKDYRTHFVLNCAARGCPNLSKLAFTAENIDQQLETAEATFINHQRGIRFDGKTLILSKIFDWYLEDFADNEEELITLLAPKVNATMRARLNGYRGNIKYEYDWSLNEVR